MGQHERPARSCRIGPFCGPGILILPLLSAQDLPGGCPKVQRSSHRLHPPAHPPIPPFPHPPIPHPAIPPSPHPRIPHLLILPSLHPLGPPFPICYPILSCVWHHVRLQVSCHVRLQVSCQISWHALCQIWTNAPAAPSILAAAPVHTCLQ